MLHIVYYFKTKSCCIDFNLVKRIWIGPSTKVWGGGFWNSCQLFTNVKDKEIDECKAICEEEPLKCNAFYRINSQSQECVLRYCSIPMPAPSHDPSNVEKMLYILGNNVNTI